MPRAPARRWFGARRAVPCGFAGPAAELDRFPRHRISPHARWLWWRLDQTQRRDLGRRELVRLLNAGMCAQSVLSMLRAAESAAGGRGEDLTGLTVVLLEGSDHNSTMFVRLVAATGLVPYRPPLRVRLIARAAPWLPAAPVDHGLAGLIDQLTAQLAGALADDPGRQTQVRRAARLRLLTGVLHLERTREDLIVAVGSRAPLSLPLRRWALAAALAAAHAVVIHPEVYRAPEVGTALALADGAHRSECGPVVRCGRTAWRRVRGRPARVHELRADPVLPPAGTDRDGPGRRGAC
ncbi:diiron oxygenase [Nocardia mexicana]|nr:diiron oxygenase [Nocardia mexicana]